MSAYIDRRQPIPSVRTVASHINQGGAYQPTASPSKRCCAQPRRAERPACTHADMCTSDILCTPTLSFPSFSGPAQSPTRKPPVSHPYFKLWRTAPLHKPIAVKKLTHASCGQDLWGRCAGRNKEDAATLVAGLEKLHLTRVADRTASVALAEAQDRIALLEQELQAAKRFAQLLEDVQQVQRLPARLLAR